MACVDLQPVETIFDTFDRIHVARDYTRPRMTQARSSLRLGLGHASNMRNAELTFNRIPFVVVFDAKHGVWNADTAKVTEKMRRCVTLTGDPFHHEICTCRLLAINNLMKWIRLATYSPSAHATRRVLQAGTHLASPNRTSSQ
jgi:hypothetical protein